MKRKECKYKGCSNPVWSGGLCKNHILQKPMKKKSISMVEKLRPFQDQVNRTHARYDLFMNIWFKRGPKSEVSGERIFGEPLSTFFHHILPKGKYPMADLDEENIIILTSDEHNTVENKMYIFEEVNKRREYLIKKYDL